MSLSCRVKDHKPASATSKGDNGAGATDGDEVGATPDTFLVLIIELLTGQIIPQTRYRPLA
jgi:hypothetical protein